MNTITEWMERQKQRRAANRLVRELNRAAADLPPAEFAFIFANDLPRILRQRGQVPAADLQPRAGKTPPGLAPTPEVRHG